LPLSRSNNDVPIERGGVFAGDEVKIAIAVQAMTGTYESDRFYREPISRKEAS
jgi:hypothetical protein